MLLLNAVCFGAWDDGPLRRNGILHSHVISALNSAMKPGFRLDWRPAGPELGMLEPEALVTYMPAHAGQLYEDGTSALWGKDTLGYWPSELGAIGGHAVVLDACDTASDGWLYSADGRLRAECQTLLGKPILGGSGDKSKPQKSHGKWILGELVDALSSLKDADLEECKLLALLEDVLDRAATKAKKDAPNSTLHKAYKVRTVTSELQRH